MRYCDRCPNLLEQTNYNNECGEKLDIRCIFAYGTVCGEYSYGRYHSTGLRTPLKVASDLKPFFFGMGQDKAVGPGTGLAAIIAS